MTEIIKTDTDYAMRVLVCLAGKREAPVTAGELSASQQIPLDFTYKILQRLTGAGIIKSHLGIHGGFSLALSPEKITLLQVVSAVQGPIVVRRCCLDITDCPRKATCEITARLGELQKQLTGSLGKITLADVTRNRGDIKEINH